MDNAQSTTTSKKRRKVPKPSPSSFIFKGSIPEHDVTLHELRALLRLRHELKHVATLTDPRSCHTTQKAIDSLVARGLIERRKPREEVYRLTRPGMMFLLEELDLMPKRLRGYRK